MKIIDRYIYTVIKRLPEKMRDEVEADLRGNIADMLPEDAGDEKIRSVLYSLGNPAVLAQKYRGEERYLIRPGLFEQYICVLRIVLIVILCVSPLIAFLTVLTDQNMQGLSVFGHILLQTLLIALQGCFQGFAWVTVVFAIIDRTKSSYPQWPYSGKEWTLEDLEEDVESKGRKVDTAEQVFSIIFNLLFIGALCGFAGYIGWYSYAGGILEIIPLFEKNVLTRYIPFIIVLGAVNILLSILLLIGQSWNRRLAIYHAIVSGLAVVFGFLFLGNEQLFSTAFLELFAQTVHTDLAHFTEIWHGCALGLALLIMPSHTWEVYKVFRKLGKTGTSFKQDK